MHNTVHPAMIINKSMYSIFFLSYYHPALSAFPPNTPASVFYYVSAARQLFLALLFDCNSGR
jgi:hypothetical protein